MRLPGTYISPAETDLYYLQSRYYDSETCRFLNADGLIDNRGTSTQNLYTYCGNNPVNRVDSSGEIWWVVALKVVVKVVAVTVVYFAARVVAAEVKNVVRSQKEPDFAAVDELLKNRDTSNNGVVKLAEDKERLLYNKENREYASKIIKEDLGPDSTRTVEDISAEIFAHQFGSDMFKQFSIFSGIIPKEYKKYDIYERMSLVDVNEDETRIALYRFVEEIFEWE